MVAIPIPGLERHRPPVIYRVTIGEMEGGKPQFKKGDRFTITRPSLEDANRWVEAQDLQAALKVVAGEKPTVLPILLWSNDLDDFLLQERCCYLGKSRRVCHSTGFDLKSPEECARQRIPYPPADPNFLSDEYYQGTAELRFFEEVAVKKNGRDTDQKRFVLKSHQPRVCDPAFCPFATGDVRLCDGDPAAPYKPDLLRLKDQQARKLCKFHTAMSFTLDLPETNRAGALAKFVSTGIWTAQYLRASLMQIRAETGGWLAAVPLQLVFRWKQGMTPMGMQKLPYVYCESRIPTGRLQAAAEEISGRLQGNRQRMIFLQEQTTAIIRAEVDGLGDPETAREFWQQETPPAPPAPDYRAEVETLGQQAGLSPAVIAEDLEQCNGDADLLALRESYRAMLEETPPGEDLGEVLEGEYEAAPADDAPPLKESWAQELQALGERLGLPPEKAAEKVAAAVKQGPDACAALETTWRRQVK